MAGQPAHPIRAAPRRRLLRELLRSRAAWAGLALLVPIVLACAFADVLAPYHPNDQSISGRLQPPGGEARDRVYVLGSDSLGRDVLSRILHGGRISLTVGLAAVALGGLAGVTLGLVSGYFGGRADAAIMRLADIQLAVPTLILALTIMAIFGPSLRNVVIVLGITGWVPFARIVRGEVLSVRENEYVLAATAIGANHTRTMLHHILPNVTASIIVMASLRLGTVILLEAALSFLGLGIQPPTPTWGNVIADGRDLLYSAWWVSTFPGVALSLTVIGINMIGDWLRDTLDPRLQSAS
jgi:peptide/nickel transport system permease protein